MKIRILSLLAAIGPLFVISQTKDWQQDLFLGPNTSELEYAFTDNSGALNLSFREFGAYSYRLQIEFDRFGSSCVDTLRMDTSDFVIKKESNSIFDTTLIPLITLNHTGQVLNSFILQQSANCFSTVDSTNICLDQCVLNQGDTVFCLCNSTLYAYHRPTLNVLSTISIPDIDTNSNYLPLEIVSTPSFVYLVSRTLNSTKVKLAVIKRNTNQILVDTIYAGTVFNGVYKTAALEDDLVLQFNDSVYVISSLGIVQAAKPTGKFFVNSNLLWNIRDSVFQNGDRHQYLEVFNNQISPVYSHLTDSTAALIGSLISKPNGDFAMSVFRLGSDDYLFFGNIYTGHKKLVFEQNPGYLLSDKFNGVYSYYIGPDSLHVKHYSYSLGFVEYEDLETLTLYPNPSSNHIFIEGVETGQAYQIADVLGRIYQQGNYQETIDVSDLPAGLYLVQMSEHSWKFLKK